MEKYKLAQTGKDSCSTNLNHMRWSTGKSTEVASHSHKLQPVDSPQSAHAT